MTRAVVLATEYGATGGVDTMPRRRARGSRALVLAVGCSVAALMAVVATPALAAVPPPTNVHANAEGSTQVALAWTASTAGTSGAGAITSYKVLRNGSQIGTTDPFTTNYLDTGRSANTAYTYTVIAVSGSNASAPSTSASPTTAASVQTLTQCSTTPYGGGHYALGANLVAPVGQPCLQFSAATNVSLDCQGHSISIQQGLGDNYAAAVSLPGDNGFLVVNCNFDDESAPVSGSPNSDNIVSVTNSSNGVFENDTMAMGQGVEWVYSTRPAGSPSTRTSSRTHRSTSRMAQATTSGTTPRRYRARSASTTSDSRAQASEEPPIRSSRPTTSSTPTTSTAPPISAATRPRRGRTT